MEPHADVPEGGCELKSCPSQDVIQRFREGRCAAAERAALAPHFDVCPRCQAVLDEPDTALAEIGRQALPPPPPIPSYEYVLDGDGHPEVVGRGGLGVVFLARHQALVGSPLRAVKVLHAGASVSRRSRERFLREIEAITELGRQGHAGFVQIFERGNAGGCLYYAMEFVATGSLHKLLARYTPTLREAAQWLLALAEAMAIAHRSGVIHRDLKPTNILVVLEQDPPAAAPRVRMLKVADFSHARLLHHASGLTQGEPVGTPNYMAPEQARGEPANALSDVYGLCAILYRLLTGRPPFNGPSPEATRELVRSPDHAPPAPALRRPALRRGAGAELTSICQKGLSKEPRDRYPTVEALAEDLRRFLNGEPVWARPVGRAERLWRWSRRHPAQAMCIGTILLASAAGAAEYLYQQRLKVMRLEQTLRLLDTMVQANTVVPLLGYEPSIPALEPLLMAEAHYETLLAEDPLNLDLRAALTAVSGRLGALYLQRGQVEAMNKHLKRAVALWESPAPAGAEEPKHKEWLATAWTWQMGCADFAQGMRSALRAEALWHELTETQPGNVLYLRRALQVHVLTKRLIRSKLAAEASLEPLRQTQADLRKLIARDPNNPLLHKRMAFSSLLLGDVHHELRSGSEAIACWAQADQHYQAAFRTDGDDLLGGHLWGITCARLIRAGQTGPYYGRAVALLNRTGERLAALRKSHVGDHEIVLALSEAYCFLAGSHTTVGEFSLAESVSKAKLAPLAAQLADEGTDLGVGLETVETLLWVAGQLREADQPEAARPVARHAAAIASRYAAFPSRDLGFLNRLGSYLLATSALLNQLHDSADSLHQASRARELFAQACRLAPEQTGPKIGLSDAWMRIGKARWNLEEHEQALAAFRESAEVARQVFEHSPSVLANRVQLSRCYDRLVDWGGQRGDVAALIAVLQARESLWPENASELARTARAYQRLAQRLAGDRGATAPDAVTRERCLAESRRLARASETAALKAANANRDTAPVAKRQEP